MNVLPSLLRKALEDRGISIRQAAREMDISHTTLIAARDQKRDLDLDTVKKIASWLDIPVSTLINNGTPDQETNDLVFLLKSILEAEPALKEVFTEAGGALSRGEIDADDFRDIVEYAAFKLSKAGKRG